MDYWTAREIEPGDTITYLIDGVTLSAEVTGEIHDYSDRPGQVIYVPTSKGMVNRLYILTATRPDD